MARERAASAARLSDRLPARPPTLAAPAHGGHMSAGACGACGQVMRARRGPAGGPPGARSGGRVGGTPLRPITSACSHLAPRFLELHSLHTPAIGHSVEALLPNSVFVRRLRLFESHEHVGIWPPPPRPLRRRLSDDAHRGGGRGRGGRGVGHRRQGAPAAIQDGQLDENEEELEQPVAEEEEVVTAAPGPEPQRISSLPRRDADLQHS